jgi:hypothetical protein
LGDAARIGGMVCGARKTRFVSGVETKVLPDVNVLKSIINPFALMSIFIRIPTLNSKTNFTFTVMLASFYVIYAKASIYS